MSDLTLFDLDTAVWAPIWEPDIEDYGWYFDTSISQIPLHADGSKVSKPEWDEFTNTPRRCRDCGRKCAFNAGGASSGHSYRVCDDCTQVDGCRLRCCTPIVEPGHVVFSNMTSAAHCACGWFVSEKHTNDDGDYVPYTGDEVLEMCAEHARPRHVSHWGESHFPEQHDALVRAREQRRMKYLATIGDHA